MFHVLMKARRPATDWWLESVRVLQEQGIQVAVTGAVAAIAYMPPRQTGDLDLAVAKANLGRSGEVLARCWRAQGGDSLATSNYMKACPRRPGGRATMRST